MKTRISLLIFVLGCFYGLAQSGEKFNVIQLKEQTSAPTSSTWTDGSMYFGDTKSLFIKVNGVWTLVGNGLQDGSNNTTFFELNTNALNNIEIGVDGPVGNTDYVRIQGGETTSENPLIYLTDNHASLNNWSIADIDALGATSLITRAWAVDYVANNAGSGSGDSWTDPVDSSILLGSGTGGTFNLGSVLDPFGVGYFQNLVLQGSTGNHMQYGNNASGTDWWVGNSAGLIPSGITGNTEDYKIVYEFGGASEQAWFLNHTGTATNPRDLMTKGEVEALITINGSVENKDQTIADGVDRVFNTQNTGKIEFQQNGTSLLSVGGNNDDAIVVNSIEGMSSTIPLVTPLKTPILDVLVESASTYDGAIVEDSTDGELYCSNGTNWIKISVDNSFSETNQVIDNSVTRTVTINPIGRFEINPSGGGNMAIFDGQEINPEFPNSVRIPDATANDQPLSKGQFDSELLDYSSLSQTASFIASESDLNRRHENTGANDIDVTIPSTIGQAGDFISFAQLSTGKIKPIEGSGTIFKNTYETDTQYEVLTYIKASDGEWYTDQKSGVVYTSYLANPNDNNANPELITGLAMSFSGDNTNTEPTWSNSFGATASVVASTHNYGPYSVRLIANDGSSDRIQFTVSGLTNGATYSYYYLYSMVINPAEPADPIGTSGRLRTNGGVVSGINHLNLSNTDWTDPKTGTFTTNSTSVIFEFYPSNTGNSGDAMDFIFSLEEQ